MSATPRTDSSNYVQPHPSGGLFVPIELARQLECELNDEREHCARYASQVQSIVDALGLPPTAHFSSVMESLLARLNQLTQERNRASFFELVRVALGAETQMQSLEIANRLRTDVEDWKLAAADFAITPDGLRCELLAQEREIAELLAWRRGKKGIEDFYIAVEKCEEWRKCAERLAFSLNECRNPVAHMNQDECTCRRCCANRAISEFNRLTIKFPSGGQPDAETTPRKQVT